MDRHFATLSERQGAPVLDESVQGRDDFFECNRLRLLLDLPSAEADCQVCLSIFKAMPER